MEIINLTEDNIDEYTGFIEEDMAENIGRVYYDGIVIKDENNPVAGMIWTLINTKDDENRSARIVWLKTESEENVSPLFDKYAEIISTADIVASEIYLPAKTGKHIKQALKDIGFDIALTEGDVISVKLSEIEEIDFVKKIAPPEDIMPLRVATQRDFNAAVRRMANSGHTGVYEDLSFLPRLFFENDISCYCQEDGAINGLFLCHERPSGMLEIVLMSVVGNDNAKRLPQLIAYACESAFDKYDPETKVIINRHNYASLALGEKIFPINLGIPMYMGKRDEMV